MLYEIEHLKKGLMKEVTFHEIHTIEIIGNQREITMQELASKASVKQSTMTAMVDKLIKKGFVKRYRSEDDRRIVLVQLSKHGEMACAEHKKVHQNITNLWLKILSEKERSDLMKIMEKIALNMK
jgi:DNA-binding MarR family transcriptional regulator